MRSHSQLYHTWRRFMSHTSCTVSRSDSLNVGSKTNSSNLRLRSLRTFVNKNLWCGRYNCLTESTARSTLATGRSSACASTLLLASYSLKRYLHKMSGCKPTLETLNFDNLALRTLPVDPNVEKTQRQVSGACFSKVTPTPVDNPTLVCMSLPALGLLDVSEDEARRDSFVHYFSGNRLLPGSETAAHCYCGHQFGYFSGQLGDGAAMYLGEVVNQSGDRWEFQLKGAGLTPYSRTADGRKVLRSSIREFLCSEAIHNLGIPTTRAGSCITSDSTVVRDIFYNGNPIDERCTLVLRIAPTFLRFGSFEIFKPVDSETGRQGPSVGRRDLLELMLDYTVENFYPQIWRAHSEDKPQMYGEFFKEIVRRTARLVADWQCVGWCHGVLNTDNMSIVGVTIDYGPFGFMDKFDPDFICNGSDDRGRYRYSKQPEICKWNCRKLAEALREVVPLTDTLPHLELFDQEFASQYKSKMRDKFGLKKELSEDGDLVDSFLSTMQETRADFTNSFRSLSSLPLPSSPDWEDRKDQVLARLCENSSGLEDLRDANKPRMDPRQLSMLMMLSQSNPELLQALGQSSQLLKAEMDKMEQLDLLQTRTEAEIASTNREKWSSWLAKYAVRLRKEEEGIEDTSQLSMDRVRTMNQTNPKFILRNYVAQRAIEFAEKGDYSEVRRVLRLLQDPYAERVDLNQDSLDGAGGDSSVDSQGATSFVDRLEQYEGRIPEGMRDLRVT